MAWLQNLAGKAEDLLNKIDQNAATVLNESNTKIPDNFEIQIPPTNAENIPEIQQTHSSPVKSGSSSTSLHLLNEISPIKEIVVNTEPDIDGTAVDNGISFTATGNNSKNGMATTSNLLEEYVVDKQFKSDVSSISSKSSSMHNSFILAEETNYFNDRIAKLEFENQDLNKQLLNIQHLYSELRNENSNLQYQVERSNEQVSVAQQEKEQYIARAQRILQEKEKLISLKKENNTAEEAENIFATYNEELKREIQFQQEKNKELSEKNTSLTNDIQSLQMQHQIIQNGYQQSIRSLEENLLTERKFRKIAEDECQVKHKDLYEKSQAVTELNNQLQVNIKEIEQLKETIRQRSNISSNEDLESRIQSLTQTLMMKQNKLETVTTERNALRLQMEKIENEYEKKLAHMQRAQAKVVNVNDINDYGPQVPQFMRVSPFDAGVTRRVKRAYSTVDAISVRTGIFLRRYPVARVFVFCYMVLLHIWVLIILFLYAPNNQVQCF